MATKQAATNLSQSLPFRLRNFFAQYPPQYYAAKVIPKPGPPPEKKPATTTTEEDGAVNTSSTSSASASAPTSSSKTEQQEKPTASAVPSLPADTDLKSFIQPLPSPYTPSRASKPSETKRSKFNDPNDPSTYSPSRAILRSLPDHPNPFLPYRNPVTGRWRGARYSLRRQADLVKLAAKYGVEELLPPGKKSKEYKEVRRAEVGLRIRGTGVGQKVKGHKWERTMGARLEERKQAMLKMPEMIREWKQRGHGRGWKKYPKK